MFVPVIAIISTVDRLQVYLSKYYVTFNMYSVQLAVKTQIIYYTVCTIYKKLHVSAYFGHLQVFRIA